MRVRFTISVEIDGEVASGNLVLVPGSRVDDRVQSAVEAIRRLLEEKGHLSGRAVVRALTGREYSKRRLWSALRHGANSGALHVTGGPRGAHLYSHSGLPPTASRVNRGQSTKTESATRSANVAGIRPLELDDLRPLGPEDLRAWDPTEE
jgi:hypothetical protein